MTVAKFAAEIIQISHREMKKQSKTERSTSVYKSYDVFCEKVIKAAVIKNKQKKYMKHLLEKFVIIAKDTENVDASKYSAFKLKQRPMKVIPNLCSALLLIVYVENLEILYMWKYCICGNN